MGKAIRSKIKGMGWQAKVTLILVCTLLTSIFMYQGLYHPGQGDATPVATQGWSTVYGGTSFPVAGGYTYAITPAANSNRMLVVAVSSTITAAATQTCTVTYGGKSLTQAVGDGTTSAQQHTYLFYLNDANIAAATGTTLIATVTGGTSAYNHVMAAVYTGVDQSASPITNSQNYNGGATSSSAIGPFATALTIGSGDQAVEVVNLTRTGSTTARTVGTWATNWASTFTASGSNSSGSQYAVSTTIGSDSTAGTTTSQHTVNSSNTALRSMSAMSLKSAPTLTAAAPASAAPGTSNLSVNLTGTNLSSGTLTANFGAGITVNNITYVSATQATANISIDAAAAYGYRTVTVTGANGVATGANLFSVINPNGPTISTISPATGGQGGTQTITITGSNYQSGATVSFSGTGVTVSSTNVVNATTITANVTVASSAATGVRDVTITNPDTSAGTKLSGFTVTAAPTVTAASPVNGKLGWTGNVTVTGTNFASGAVAYFNDAGVTVNSTTFVSSTSLTANVTVASNATLGGRKIQVTNPDAGVGVSASNLFTAVDPAVTPTITSLTQTTLGQGATGETFTITGTNFVSGSTVSFSGSYVTSVTTTYVNATTLNVAVNVSTSATGTATLTVTNPDTQTATTTITFTSRPGSTLTAAPNNGYTGISGLNVVLTGTNFQSGAVASFSNSGITVNSTTYQSSTQLTANINIASNATAGASSVTITNPDGGTRSVSSVFTVSPVGVFSAAPALAQGATQTVTITGQGFAAGASVAVSGTGISLGTPTIVDANHITISMTADPAATLGNRDITVTVGTSTGTGTGVLSINGGPSLTGLSPATLRQGDTADVTITGGNLQPGVTIQFNGTGVTMNSATYVSATQLTANVTIDPNAALGAQTVTLVNPDGGKITGGSFTIALTGKTIAGAVSFTRITDTSIAMVIAYSGDGDNDGSCTVSYGATSGYELGTVTATKANGVYTANFNNLAGGADGAGKLYYFQVNFSDADGVIGNPQVALTQPTRANALIHNSQNTFSAKWAQGWGIDGGKYGAFTCSTCHNNQTSNAKLVATSIQTPSLENWSSNGASSVTIVYNNPATTMGNDGQHATSTNVCEACHARTAHHKFNNAGADHNGTVDCTTCHAHNEGFIPSCKTCHATAQGNNGYRRQIVGNGGDFFTNMSGHGTFADISSKTCTVCHDSSSHRSYSDGVSVALANADTGAKVVYDGTAATAPATAGVCLSCHDADGATRLGNIALAPFTASNDFTAPTNVNQYWPASGGAHQVYMQCFNCHGNSKGTDGSTTNPKYNGHASGRTHMLQDSAFDVTNPNAYCFNCHNAASTDPNKSTKDISGQFALTNKHVTAKCFDCHGDENNATDSMHSLRSGSQTYASGVIAGNLSNSTGRSMTWSTTSWGGATASASIPSNGATGEWQICFKCHAAVGTGTTPDVNNASYTNAGALTNLALEFNPNNGSAHPVVVALNNQVGSTAPRALTTAKMQAAWQNVGSQVMSCSDCHATSSTGGKGPHGSSIKWMLTGTNKAWPYTLASYNGTSTGGTLRSVGTLTTGSGTNDGLFCLNCHTISGTNSFHSVAASFPEQHSNTSGPAQCANCHIRVPHGGKISRLLQTTNAPARYRASGTSSSTPLFKAWGKTGVTVKGASYSGNFGSSCSEHSGGASGGEAW
ncbi:IPT/TIG domain-containing protein [Geomesophilobacter sediminis]|uniref:IPT/TIG domain-containing protein n=1 Tax=Geomesophilobacter sediminis TaxID=2798584 RepID=A0A8J7LZ05_9BACT|nr:IPT/TIG domain-containing protein [Geomesophilobacter sediminis]MBJ6725716.1 IPT/TIG domain-containing protein [Geomesophilobacter sediminis]